jgi:hypothetical protein
LRKILFVEEDILFVEKDILFVEKDIDKDEANSESSNWTQLAQSCILVISKSF